VDLGQMIINTAAYAFRNVVPGRLQEGLHDDRTAPQRREKLDEGDQSVLRLRSQPTKPTPIVPRRMAPGAGTATTLMSSR